MINPDRRELLKQGFSNDQVREIQEGFNAGVDVSKYYDKEMLAACMRQIRYGLMSKVDVSVYASKDFDWFQMEEIRLGLEDKLDVKEYANPDISYETMREVRTGLLENLDLFDFIGLKPKVLRQYRMGLEQRIDLMPYIEQGYDAEQLEQILLALSLNISEIGDYINTTMRGVCISEICECLSKGIDVSIVSGGQYNWQQMREIRLGLEHRINTRAYMNPWFDRNQMEQIRLGLEHGVDVSGYARLMFTASDMKKKRLALEHAVTDEEVKKSENVLDIAKSYDHFDILISRDEMEADIVFTGAGLSAEYTMSNLLPILAKRGLKKGIDQTALMDVLLNGKPGVQYTIAKGQKAQDGKNGYYEWFVRTDFKKEPKINEDGSVNYHDVEWFEMVEKGEKICEYHKSLYGTFGYTVTGRICKPLPGKEAPMLKGRGFAIGDDNTTYYASVTGKFESRDDYYVEISEVLHVKEVTYATGNVRYKGSVHVLGDVGAGAVIYATGDIIINGFVEGAQIEAGGNITLVKGANGNGRGLIRALGNVQGKFFEKIKVVAGGDIMANYTVSCELYSEKKILIFGRQGSIIGGQAYATNGIISDNIGNKANMKTQLSVGVNEDMMKKLSDLEKQIKGVDKELEFFRNAYEDMKLKYPPEIRNTMNLFLKTEDAIYTKELQMNELLIKTSEQRKKITEARLARVAVRKTLYDGVKLKICQIPYEPKSMIAVQFSLFKNEVISQIYEESSL